MATGFTDREILQHFVSAADELIASKYLLQARAGGQGSAVGFFRGIGFAMARSAPDTDFVKAALLTIRFFCQNNEPTSLQRMAELVDRLPVDQQMKDQLARARTDFNDHLKGKPHFAVPAGIGADTRGEIFDTFLYGHFAHANPEKKRRVQSWQALPEYDGLRSNFDLTLIHFISAIAVIRSFAAVILATGAV